ncbi:LysR family transcriptional regulator [Pontibacter ummariensis]|uniref:Transcriptional regulator, LysR family n=1 Tax=Pontibacter ummariensis TaxID=1610492 RepID=A0A239IWN8_9BACT|nr:LysR family transcriptional regulator [Pontibacter ummariensis]PRY08974.1 LysR family transcriptional regulator [Pontibacter ummariensis]SNS97433.1 transcriptional regulator, LysR family [Pontibacter ummariensis]
MELQQIKYFLALAQELHFWHTAERMFITQSALSRQIKALEDELGIKLFERNKRNVKLTEAGAFLRDQWLPLLDEINRTHLQARKIHEGASGLVRIGYPGSTAYGFMPNLIASISRTMPELKVELVEPTDISFEQMLLSYQMDIAFRRDPAENPALHSEYLYSEPFALVVSDDHRLNEKSFTGLHDLKGEKFILSNLAQTTFYTASLRQIFEDNNLTPDVRIESDFGGMVLGLVSKGLGVTILPFSYSYSELPNVRFIMLPYQMNLYVTWRKNDNSSVLRNMLQQAKEAANEYTSQIDRI